MPAKVKSRLLEKRKPLRTDGSQIGPGWYNAKRQSKIDNRASGVLTSTLDRSVNPAAPTMTREDMRNVGPGTYSWRIEGREGPKIPLGDRWSCCGHMCQTETTVNPRLVPAGYRSDNYHNYTHSRYIEQCNRSAAREQQQAGQQALAGEGKYPITIHDREEARLNACRPALDVMPNSVYWRSSVLISDAPRFSYQKGPQNHLLKNRPNTAPCKPINNVKRSPRLKSPAHPQTATRSQPVFINQVQRPPAKLAKRWDDPGRLRARFWVEEDKLRHCAGQPLTSKGQAVDVRGLKWSYFDCELRTL